MKIWKKNAVLATVILFVCVAVYLNWSYGRGEASAGEEITGAAAEEETDLGDTGLVNGEGENDSLVALDENEGTAEQASEEGDYFNTARLTRQQARDSSLAILRESSGDEKLSQETRDKAAGDIAVIADYAISEAKIESLVIAKGFKDCVAFISEDGIDVVVSTMGAELQAEDVSKIKDIVVDETGLPVDKIKIIEVTE